MTREDGIGDAWSLNKLSLKDGGLPCKVGTWYPILLETTFAGFSKAVASLRNLYKLFHGLCVGSDIRVIMS